MTDPAMAAHVRRTLVAPAEVSGVTLFTGVQTGVIIRPARAGEGIVFVRADLPGRLEIPARVAHVIPESRRTVLSADPRSRGAASVQTVEHIMSALVGSGVTDALVEVHGPEIPIGDGSAIEFVRAIARAGGVRELRVDDPDARSSMSDGARVGKPIIIRETDEAGRGVSIEAHPSDRPGLELEYRLDYGPGAPIAPQSVSIFVPEAGGEPRYAAEIAPARTFCLAQEAEAMRRMGLFAHLTPAQMLVIGERGPIDNAYRFPDEPARHKVLDLLGDLALCGKRVRGRVVATRTGHSHNHAMARALAAL